MFSSNLGKKSKEKPGKVFENEKKKKTQIRMIFPNVLIGKCLGPIGGNGFFTELCLLRYE